MKLWSGSWLLSGNCFQKRNWIIFWFKTKLSYCYHHHPPKCSYKAGKALLCTKLCETFLKRGLTTRGRERSKQGASSTDQWNWDTEAKLRRSSWAELGRTLGMEGKSSLTTLITILRGAEQNNSLLPTCFIPNLPHPRNWLTLAWKSKNPSKAGNKLEEKKWIAKAKWPTCGSD